MNSLKHRQEKLQNHRKNTPWRKFLMDIVPWQPLMLYRTKEKIGRYPDTERTPTLVSPEEFWDLMESNTITKDYSEMLDWTNFFETLKELRGSMSMPNLWHGWGNENTEYADVSFASRNQYLTFMCCFDVSDCMYAYNIEGNVSDVIASAAITNNTQVVYESSAITESMNVFYSRYIVGSNNIWFSTNLIGCSECVWCANLTNKKYCIQNKQYEKDEYLAMKAQILSQKQKFPEYKKSTYVEWNCVGSTNCEWSHLIRCEDVTSSRYAWQVKYGNNNLMVGGQKEYTLEYSYDNTLSGNQAKHVYGCHGVSPGEHLYCSMNSWGNLTNVYYSYFMIESSFCFGCIWLKNKSYCIFNKQYEKDEWYEKVNEIFALVEQQWVLGEFFPWSMNPFYFNDTMATLVDDSFTKEEVEAAWYLWRDEIIKVDIPEWVDVVSVADLWAYEWRMIAWEFVSLEDDESIQWDRTIHPDILKKVIKDDEGNYYRIMPAEFKFLKRYWLPLPRKHWLERLKELFIVN